MKDYSEVYDLIRKSHTVNAVPHLVAEFSHNRYSEPTVFNYFSEVDEEADTDIFPLESIIRGSRPTRGIIKMRVGEWYAGEEYETNPESQRYYIGGADDVYQYWCSTVRTDATGSFGADTQVNPQVTYESVVKANKVVIGLENTHSSPTNYSVFVMEYKNGPWVEVANHDDITIPNNGRIELYYSSNGWTQEKNIDENTTLAGVKLEVYQMDKPNTWFNLIELGLYLEWNMTSYLVEIKDTFDLGTASDLKPIGEATSNVADITLFNHFSEGDGYIFSDDNPRSLFKGLMEENVKFTLDYIYTISETNKVSVRQFEMYSTGHWSAYGNEQVDVDLRDASKFLQEIKPPSVFYENRTIPGVIFRLLDTVGFNAYDIGKHGKHIIDGEWVDIESESEGVTIPYFWTNSDRTAWDILQDFASGTQTAIYIDSFGKLQVLTKRQVFNEQYGHVWTLRGKTKGEELVDIQEYELDETEISNDITVNYQTTEFEEFVSGIRRNTVVWQPEEETVYVKCSDLAADLPASGPGSDVIRFSAEEAALWPFESIIQLEGEMISYKGKQYTYYPLKTNNIKEAASHSQKVWLESYDDYKKYHFDLTPIENRHLNKYTGLLKITERGMWNTPVQDHKIETLDRYRQINQRGGVAYTDKSGFWKDPKRLATYKNKYTTARNRYNRSKTTGNKRAMNAASAEYKSFEALYKKYRNAAITDGIDVPSQKSVVRMQTNANYAADHYLMALRGNASSDLGYRWYGTRIMFNRNSSLPHGVGGIIFQSQGGADADAYFVEIADFAGTKKGVGRVRIYRNNAQGKTTWQVNKDMIFVKDKWYSLDILVEGSDESHSYTIHAYVDGQRVVSASVPVNNKIHYTGRFGIHTRRSTDVSFEYLYAISGFGNWLTSVPENFSRYDRMTNGFASSLAADYLNDVYGRLVKRKIKGKVTQVNLNFRRFFFDEFGPIAHEIRKFDVKFNGTETAGMPVIAPFVFLTNTSNADVLDMNSNVFGAEIYVINRSRDDAALKGTDDNHQLGVYGLVLKRRAAQTVNIKNEKSIQAIGTKELKVDSQWIQNTSTANELASWISQHWSQATDTLDVTIFGNPLIEVGDVVRVDIPDADIDEETHRYFVMSANNSFADGGLSTNLQLRRIRN